MLTAYKIIQRGDKWLVTSEDGSKVLGEHSSKADAEKQLAAVEANKHAHAKPSARAFRAATVRFDGGAASGSVRAGVFDRFTSWGTKIKAGAESVFDENTLGEMVRNFRNQQNDVYMDYDHQTVLVEQNGQPAIALAWYSALCGVRGGKVFAFAAHEPDETHPNRPVNLQPPDASGMEDGLYGYRYEVTDAGQRLLSGGQFRYISPLFDVQGTDEQDRPIGYVLHCVAAVNLPFQDGVPITFAKRIKMAKYEKDFLSKLGLAEDASDEQVMAAMMARMAKYDEDAAKSAEKMAAEPPENDKDKDGMAKMDAKDGDPEVMADDDEGASAMSRLAFSITGKKGKVKLSALTAAHAAKFAPASEVQAFKQKLAALEAAEQKRAESEQAQRFNALADRAAEIGYFAGDDEAAAKKKRDSLIAFAKADYAGAEAFINGLPQVQALSRVTKRGNPVGYSKPAQVAQQTDEDGVPEIGGDFAASMRKFAKDNKVDLWTAYHKRFGVADKSDLQ